MRKKHDEGYALIFVLVVMVVLSIIAISLMSSALKNLTNQTAAVDRMQEKYTAQGEMERMVVKIIQDIEKLSQNDAKREHNSVISGAQDELTTLLSGCEVKWASSNALSCTIILESSIDNGEQAQIICAIDLHDVIGTEMKDGATYYVVKKPSKISYESYTVNYITPPATEGGGS